MNPQYNNGPGYPPADPQYGQPQGYHNAQGEAASYYAGAPPQQQLYPSQGQPVYGQPPPYQHDQPHQDGQDGSEGERGFLGALGGGAAGAFGGHKIGGKVGHSKLSTVLGAVAGAVAGHKLQEGVSDWKDHRDEEKEKKKREEEEEARRQEEEDRRRREEEDRRRKDDDRHHHHNNHHQQPHHPQQARSVNYAGNFSSSSRDIRLDHAGGEYLLRASCARVDGSWQDSSISLNRIIENDRGSFRWCAKGGRTQPAAATAAVTVQPGDTLRGIAARFGCSFEDIARHNGVQNPDMIYPGQMLQIPNSGANSAGGGGGGGGGGGNFGASARDVRLVDGGRRLEGELLRDGRWVGSSIVLDERIGNSNGTLTFTG